jgi:hypothetical protein
MKTSTNLSGYSVTWTRFDLGASRTKPRGQTAAIGLRANGLNSDIPLQIDHTVYEGVSKSFRTES